jgi:hypothetical protein
VGDVVHKVVTVVHEVTTTRLFLSGQANHKKKKQKKKKE